MIGRMKRGAYLVNTARGKIADRDAVAAALESGQLAGAVVGGIDLTSRGQSSVGGWTYSRARETRVRSRLRKSRRAVRHIMPAFRPTGTIEEAVRYIECCRTPEGGISYSLGSGGGARLAISAAAVATLYNAGEYDCADRKTIAWIMSGGSSREMRLEQGGGHGLSYCQLYASQAYYMAGDKYWDEYFPAARDQLLKMQDRGDGSWDGDGIGKTYGTAIALIILQLPYKFLPGYQR